MLIAENMSNRRIVLQVDVEQISFLDALRWLCAPGSGGLLEDVLHKRLLQRKPLESNEMPFTTDPAMNRLILVIDDIL